MDPLLISLLTPDSSKCCLWVTQNLMSSKSEPLVLNKNMKDFFYTFSSIYRKTKQQLIVNKYVQERDITPLAKPYFLNYLEQQKHPILDRISFRDVEHLSEQLCNHKDEINNLYEEAISKYSPMTKLANEQSNIYHHFCPLNIQQEIEQKLSSHYLYTSTMDNHTVQLHTHTPKISLTERFIGELLARIHTLSILTNQKRPVIKINFWCCQTKKTLPIEKSLGSHSVNSASTYISHCHDVKVWRIEESRKVISHELFHCMGLDFHHVPDFFLRKILSVFNIVDQELLFCETYVEMWAVIINCISISELLENSEQYLSNLFDYERHYASFQTAKILHFFGFKKFEHFFNLGGFEHQSKHQSPYKQTSSILSYYILKSALLFRINDFIDFCTLYNSFHGLKFIENEKTYRQFLKLVLDSLNDSEFKKVVNKSLKLLSRIDKKSFMYTNLRLTCLETYL